MLTKETLLYSIFYVKSKNVKIYRVLQLKKLCITLLLVYELSCIYEMTIKKRTFQNKIDGFERFSKKHTTEFQMNLCASLRPYSQPAQTHCMYVKLCYMQHIKRHR
jgi:hypothetical protein